VHDLVVRRFLAAFHPDAELARTTVTVAVAAAPAPELPEPPDRYVARGKLRLVAGWQAVAGLDVPDEPLPPVADGEPVSGAYAAVAKQTEPPHRFTDATLLAAMESAGKEITDEALRLAMKDCGLGTPATRAQTIETLLERGYLARDGKALVATPLGRDLVARIPVSSLTSPELTGSWEARLARMARGEEAAAPFLADIAAYTRGFVDAIRAAPAAPAAPVAAAPPVGRCPRCAGEVREAFKSFDCAGCDFKLWKRIAGKQVSTALAGLLLRARRTQLLPGFRSKAGKRFRAALVLDDGGAVTLAFHGGAPRRPRPAPAAPAPPEAASCPKCRAGTIVAGRAAWGCSRWRDGCRLVVPFVEGARRHPPRQGRAAAPRSRRRSAGGAPRAVGPP
jgi:DNA topoisomerase-3